MDTQQYRRILVHIAEEHGASAFGICELGNLVDLFHPEIREQARKLPYAVSIGVEVPGAVLDTLTDGPNEIYKATYRAINTHLDDITFRIVQAISRLGQSAIPIPASKVVNRYPMIGHVNHREVAQKAGLGWRGRNNLLVHPVYGSRLRLSTVLTELELQPDPVVDMDCGECSACRKHCPVGAIGETPEDFSFERCRDRVIRFSRENNFGHLICGLCLNHCRPAKTTGKDHD